MGGWNLSRWIRRPPMSEVGRQTLPFQRFHALFHSLSRDLFIFRSLYLFAIGLSLVFSFGWNLPPALGCIPKQPDSTETGHKVEARKTHTGFSPSMTAHPRALRLGARPTTLQRPTTPSPDERQDSKVELFPLRSPLLGEPLLVSFPPLIDMLTFSG
jgi:hypothetical protein